MMWRERAAGKHVVALCANTPTSRARPMRRSRFRSTNPLILVVHKNLTYIQIQRKIALFINTLDLDCL